MQVRFTNIPDGPDYPAEFVELEDNAGKSIQGTWQQDGDTALLLIPNEESNLTPAAQYHADLTKLWKALGITEYKQAGGKDVFTLIVERIKELEYQLNRKTYTVYHDPLTGASGP